MGRKRNQGKARRAAKAKAREEANERNNNSQTANLSEQSLTETRLRQQADADESDKKCRHGFEPVVSTDSVFEFINAFRSSFGEAIKSGDRSLSNSLLDAKAATMDKFANMWNDSAKLEMAISVCLCMGAESILGGQDRISRDLSREVAAFARYFEQYIAVELKQTQAVPKWIKMEDTCHADLHTLIKFFWKRIPCSCLDEKYDEVKHIPEMGYCWNPQCSIPDKRVERSKTMCCSRCRCVTYCSRECQVADWREHKPYCDNDAAVIATFKAKRQRSKNP